MATAKHMMLRLKGEGQAVELEVDEVAGGVTSLAACGDVGAASLLDGNGDCGKILVHTNGDAQAVGTDEVLTAVAAGELLAVAASGFVRLRVDLDVSVAVGSA
jgi:aerobic-type carbon monoxide dehydrogenase small subunit (CoxS/CutS family)